MRAGLASISFYRRKAHPFAGSNLIVTPFANMSAKVAEVALPGVKLHGPGKPDRWAQSQTGGCSNGLYSAARGSAIGTETRS